MVYTIHHILVSLVKTRSIWRYLSVVYRNDDKDQLHNKKHMARDKNLNVIFKKKGLLVVSTIRTNLIIGNNLQEIN